MSTEAQVVLEQIRALPISDQHALLRELERRLGQKPAPVSQELYGEPLTDQDIEQSARVTFQMLDAEEKRLSDTSPKTVTADPIRSARGMFAGSRLTEALLASRAEERRTVADIAGKYRADPDPESKDHDRRFAAGN